MRFRLILDKNREEELIAVVHERNALIDRIEQLLQSHGQDQLLTGYTDDGIKLLATAEVECISVVDGKTYAIDCHKERYRLKQRLFELEQMLPPCFIRINKSTLANETCLDRFTATYSGGVDAVFRCGHREYVSRRCFAQIKRRLEGK